MIPGINAGISGMKVNSKRLSITANNIANVNSVSFKRMEAVVQSAGGNRGAMLSSVREIHSQGAIFGSGNALDISIAGDGFFKVQTAEGKTGFTRRGMFGKNAQGQLTDPLGNKLSPTITIPNNASGVSISQGGAVTAMINGQQQTLGQIQIAKFNNPSGLDRSGGVYLESTSSGAATYGTAGSGGIGQIVPAGLESSNVDIASEIVDMLMAKHGYSASAKVVKAADEMLGIALDIKT